MAYPVKGKAIQIRSSAVHTIVKGYLAARRSSRPSSTAALASWIVMGWRLPRETGASRLFQMTVTFVSVRPIHCSAERLESPSTMTGRVWPIKDRFRDAVIGR